MKFQAHRLKFANSDVKMTSAFISYAGSMKGGVEYEEKVKSGDVASRRDILGILISIRGEVGMTRQPSTALSK